MRAMAYNIRHSRRVDHDPATGVERQYNLMREVGALAFGVLLMSIVFWLAHHYLF
jgi:hypothetical protein